MTITASDEDIFCLHELGQKKRYHSTKGRLVLIMITAQTANAAETQAVGTKRLGKVAFKRHPSPNPTIQDNVLVETKERLTKSVRACSMIDGRAFTIARQFYRYGDKHSRRNTVLSSRFSESLRTKVSRVHGRDAYCCTLAEFGSS